MDKTDIEKLFLQYSESVLDDLVNDKSTVQMENKRLEQEFLSFGLTNEQISKVIAESTINNVKTLSSLTMSTALELLKTEKDNELKDAEIDLKKKELEIKDKDLELKNKELLLKDKELLLKDKELDKIDAEIDLLEAQEDTELKKSLDLAASAALKGKQALTQVKEALDLVASTNLKEAQKATEIEKALEVEQAAALKMNQAATELKQALLVEHQGLLVKRQKEGYGDNMLVKAGEFEGGLASFAINSAPDNSTTGGIINNFNGTIGQIKGRATP